MTLLLPAAFFAALDGGVVNGAAEAAANSVINDAMRDTFLRMSRGLAIILLAVLVKLTAPFHLL